MAVSTDIEAKANNIRNSIKGKDVRESLAAGIEAIDEVTEDTKSRQDLVETDFKSIQQSEAARITNEQTRQSNETVRVDCESKRITAETARETAENKREANEATRERIINNFKSFGEYDPNISYDQYNTVIYFGSTYMCLEDGTKGVLPTDNTKWLCIAQKGDDGTGGDMFKSIYDIDHSGIVDDSKRLGGQSPDYYVKTNDFTSHLENDTKHVPYAVSINSGNDYSVTMPNLTSLTDGLEIRVKFNAASADTTTLNVNGIGAKNIVDYFGNEVKNIRVNLIANLVYEATSENFILQGKGGGGNATTNDLLLGKTATVDSGQITGTMDLSNLQSQNIKDGVNVAGIIGTLEEKQDFTAYLAYAASGAYAINGNCAGFIENEGMWYTDGQRSIKLYDDKNNLLKTIFASITNITLIAVSKHYILGITYNNYVCVLDKNGTLLYTFSFGLPSYSFGAINEKSNFVELVSGQNYIIYTIEGTEITQNNVGENILSTISLSNGFLHVLLGSLCYCDGKVFYNHIGMLALTNALKTI